MPQIILQRNWVEHWDFKVEFSDSVECYPNKLVILKNKNMERQVLLFIVIGWKAVYNKIKR